MSDPIRTSAADRNYLSISDDVIMWHLGTTNPHPLIGPIPKELIPLFPDDWSSILKLSHNARPVSLTDMRIAQGTENVIDANRGASYVTIEGELGWGGGEGDQCLTIKGGSHHITIAGTIHSKGHTCDCCIGQWSDQSTDPSYELDLSRLARADGKPVTFILSRCDRSTIKLPPRGKVLWWASLANVIYWHLKRAYVTILKLIKRP